MCFHVITCKKNFICFYVVKHVSDDEHLTVTAELLQTLSIKAKGNRKKLLRVVANPVTKYLPPSSPKIGKP